MSSAFCLNQTKRCLLTKLLCVSGPDGLCDTSAVSSGDELPLPHASERQVGLFLPPFFSSHYIRFVSQKYIFQTVEH